MNLRLRRCSVLAFLFVVVSSVFAQQVDPAIFGGLRWRLVGPFRGGRSLAATGVPGKPNLFYMGSVGGGVWKTTDAGHTWEPIFDSQPIASIGAIAVAPSNPDVIYVGTGEADMRSDITYGNGVYRTSDGGRTWTHVGLEDTRQIGRIIVDPHNADVAFVAALGHAYGPNAQRGVFRTTDGGKTWERVLHKNDDTGAIDLAFDPQDSRVVFAALWQTRRTPWNVYPPSNGPGSGLYKSTDGGSTWQQLENIPSEGLGRIGIAVAPTNHERVYLVVDAKEGGVFRSDDGAKTFARVSTDRRVWQRGWYFCHIAVDPTNPDIVYVADTALYKSVDGGKTFTALKGAPGGDDYQYIWIAPDDPQRIIVASDQGTVITLNGGQTWSSWYNQPTGQFYHVATDNRFPYWIYGAQQDSGAMAVPSRSRYASITERDWHPIATGGESHWVAPDPLQAGLLFGATVSRYDEITNQDRDISPTLGRPEAFRHVWTMPLVFSPADPKKLYFGNQFLFRTTNGGQSWDQISRDLTRENPGVPPNLDPITAGYGLASPRKGVIYAIAPSPMDANLVWVGTDDGLIHVTRDDGKTWADVTPKELTPWSKVGIIEASHYDAQTAYAAIDRHRLDDLKPYIYRTRDGGRSWQLITNGIPEGHFVNVVREDPQRRGMLYAGTELGIYVSFNDGDNWQPLQLNLPTASVRDIAVHHSEYNDDLVVATHGRAFWVLDDITALRQTPDVRGAEPVLFAPQTAVRVRPTSDMGTPYPPEVPHADNPPAGAIIDYYLPNAARVVTLEVLNAKGALVRQYSSEEKPPVINPSSLEFPPFWVKPVPRLSTAAGMHRFTWEMRVATKAPASRGRRSAGWPWALPGEYIVRLTVDGKSSTQPLKLVMDPRVKATPAELEAQYAAAIEVGDLLAQVAPALSQANRVSDQLKAAERAKSNAALANTVQQLQTRVAAILGPAPEGYGSPVMPLNTDRSSLRYLASTLGEVGAAIDSADAQPTDEQRNALHLCRELVRTTIPAWQKLVTTDLPALNKQLRAAGLPEIAFENR